MKFYSDSSFILTIISVCLLLFDFFPVYNGKSTYERGFLDFLFSPCKCKCGIPNRQARILGGEHVREYEFPWLVLIQIKSLKSVSGVLINNKYVITAASPILSFTPFDIKITLGQFDRCFPDISSVNASIEKIIFHPDFNLGNRAHDLALIKITNPINFERRISPICLSHPSNRYLGQVATVVGWSENTSVKGPIISSCQPRKLGLPVLGYTQCLGTALNAQYVSPDKNCIGVIGTTNPICEVDAGGPVMFRTHDGIYELIGVLTDKNECSIKPSTALYTNINDHLFWITENTKDACYCFKI